MALMAGKLRHRLAVQTAGESRDQWGEVTEAWATDNTRWASIEPLKGRELFTAQQVNADITTRIVLRHYSGLTTSQRFLEGSRVFHIIAIINPDNRDEMMECMCTEATT